MKKGMIGIIIAVLLLSMPAAMGLGFGHVSYGAEYGNVLELHYNARNDLSEDIENAKVTLWIPDLGFYTRTSTFDIQDGEKHGQFLLLPRDELEEGGYLARLTLTSDHERDVRWIWLVVE
ncbi:MAG: hypothetical protein R6U32_05760 [Candidatus Woesearchaeota archaeon]